MKFSIKDFFSKCVQIRSPQKFADLVTFTEEMLNGTLHFLWSLQYLLRGVFRDLSTIYGKAFLGKNS